MNQFFHYNTFGLLNLSVGIFDLALGSIVYLNNPKSSLHRTFFLFTLVSSLWISSYGWMSILNNDQIAARMLIWAYFGVPFIPPTLYQFSRRANGHTQFTKIELFSYLSAVPFSVLMAIAQSQICAVRPTSWGRFNFFLNTAVSWTYFLFLMLYFLVFIGASYWNFVSAYRNATNIIQKRQARNILIGFSIVYFGMLDFAVTIGVPIYPPGFLVLTALVSVIAYSVVRHQMWDINVTIKRASVIVLSYIFLIGFSVPLLYPLAQKALGDTLSQHVLLFLTFSSLFGFIFSTGPLIYSFLERHAYWLKKHVTTGLTHELKSPIGTIRGALDLAVDQANSDKFNLKSLQDYLQIIDRSTDRLETFVKDLLLIAKSQDGVLTITPKRINLSELISEQVNNHHSSALQKGIEITQDIPENISVDGEADKIGQVVSNILSNAVKFTKQGKIQINLEHRPKAVTCSIKDEGSGIPVADLERIFDRFYQGKNVNKGSGIGLTIAKAWVEAHGGKIWAESEGEGKGTKVTFTLPVG